MRPLLYSRQWGEVDEAAAELLVPRTRLLLRIVILGNVLFGVTDPWLNTDLMLELGAVKLTVVAVQLVGLAMLRGAPGRGRTLAVGVACFIAGAVGGAVAGTITNDPFTTPLLCIAGALVTAAVVPWGVRAQLVVAATAVIAACIDIEVVAKLSVGYPLVALLLIAGISVYIAYEFERQREAEASAKLALQRRQAELAHVLRVGALGEMAAQLAHELTQPLGAIANYAAGCRHRMQQFRARAAEPSSAHAAGLALGENDALIEAVDRIAAEALRAGEIIRRLRGFVRKVEPRRVAVDVNALVGEVVHLVEGEARESNVPIELSLHPALPRVNADGVQIEQVVMNLVRNALEAMHDSPPDTASLAIETRFTEGTDVEVLVRDSGPGLQDLDAAEIFEPFQTTKSGGLGMGLAISRSIIEAHGGRLSMRPNPTHGVTFSFRLPVSRVAEREDRVPLPPGEVG